jgi:hypothetical protein
MVEKPHSFQRTLSAVIAASGREARRQVEYRQQHLLIGAITKRP